MLIRKMTNAFIVRLGEKLTLTKSVNELLFEGYDDILLQIARKMNATSIPYSKFGWFYAVSINWISNTIQHSSKQWEFFFIIEKWFGKLWWHIQYAHWINKFIWYGIKQRMEFQK